MDAVTRRQANLAERAAAFAQKHPVEDAAYAGILQRITNVYSTVRELEREHMNKMAQAKEMTSKLNAGRITLVQELLPHVITVAQMAAQMGAAVKGTYSLPRTQVPYRTLAALGQQTLIHLAVDEATLRQYGLSESLLPKLTEAVTTLEALLTERELARGGHVAARVKLKETMRELRAVVELLDGFYSLRFSPTSKERAEWTRHKKLLGAPTVAERVTTEVKDNDASAAK